MAKLNEIPDSVQGCSKWTAAHVGAIGNSPTSTGPLIRERDLAPVSDTLGIWDSWPVQDDAGMPFVFPGGDTLWMALAAPHFPDPDDRHGHARIHLLARSASGSVRHLGPAMPDGFSPGSREWSGSCVLAANGTTLTLYYTATGRRGEDAPTFGQRLVQANARLTCDSGDWALVDWRDLGEIVERNPAHYMGGDEGDGAVGAIKAFRDPAYFRDPQGGSRYIFFAGSLARSTSRYNGVVGMARAKADGPPEWQLLPPVISADGLNNELERPHVIWRDGRYYLFWSTQSHVFDPAGPRGPTGLYGMVSNRITAGWEPLNGTGLIFANPPGAPAQAYSWLVLPDLSVISFIDDWLAPRSTEGVRNFGGTFAPELTLRLDGRTAKLDG